MKRIIYLFVLLCISNPLFSQICDSQPITVELDTINACRNATKTLTANVDDSVVTTDAFLGTYTVTSSTPGTCTAEVQGTVTTLFLEGNEGSGPVPLPFNFDFYGVSYSDVCISSNGYITFSCVDETNPLEEVIPNTNEPNAMVALFWDDLFPFQISHYESNFNGENCFAIGYEAGPAIDPAQGFAVGQIILCPSGRITLNTIEYFNFTSDPADPDNSAVQGIESPDGTIGEGGFTDGEVSSCVTYTPDVGDVPCNFMGWFDADGNMVDPNLAGTLNLSGMPVGESEYYAMMDCNGVPCADTTLVIIEGCAPDDPRIEDPCSCGNTVYDNIMSDPNADPQDPTLPVDYFAEEATIEIPPFAENVVITETSNTGIYVLDPTTNMPVPGTTTFTNQGDIDDDGYDEWIATFYHPADVGYTLSVEVEVDGITTPLSISNVCEQCQPLPELVPTLGEWSLLILGLLIVIMGVAALRTEQLTSVIR